MTETNDRRALALYRPHPIDLSATQVIEFEQGDTLLDIINGLDDCPVRDLRIWLGDGEVPWQNWARVKPNIGVPLTLAVTAKGGDTVRLLATIAIVVAAAWAGDYYNSYATASAYGTTAAGSFVSVGVSLAGPMVANPLFPPPERMS